MLKIRLAMGGRKKDPVFFLVAADSRSPRDGAFLEKLGTYSPKKSNGQKLLIRSNESIQKYIKNGAQVTDRVHRLLSKEGLMPEYKYNDTPKKSASRDSK